MRTLSCIAKTLCCLALPACSGGGSGGVPLGLDGPPAMLVSRARVDLPYRFSELSLRSSRNLGTARVADRSGRETRARLHPDESRVVFARERQDDDPSSRELFVSSVDGSSAELRLTVNSARDDQPVWSPDGARVLFVSERDGDAGLWTCDDRGADVERFLPAPPGYRDEEPDWCKATDRVVFSRRDPDGHHVLWIAEGGGFGEVQLTDGGATSGADHGDRQPAFSADGNEVVFVRRSAVDRATLCVCDVATGEVTVRLAPDGEVAWPSFDPVDARLWFGLAEPTSGRGPLRRAPAPRAAGPPTLLWPDERWTFCGLAFLPGHAAAPAGGAPERLDITEAAFAVVLASDAFGAVSQLAEDDGEEFYVRTTASSGRQIAGVNLGLTLPVSPPEDVVEVRVRARARVSRIDGEPVLRMSLRNLVDNRYDTVIELTPTSTGEQELSFRTSSLRHIDRSGGLRFTVIADLEPGDPADLWIDLVEVEVLPRS